MRCRKGGLQAPFPGEIAFDLLALGNGEGGIIGDQFCDAACEHRVPDADAGVLCIAGHVRDVGRGGGQDAAVFEGGECGRRVEDGVKGELVDCACICGCAGHGGVDGVTYELACVGLPNGPLRGADGAEDGGRGCGCEVGRRGVGGEPGRALGVG